MPLRLLLIAALALLVGCASTKKKKKSSKSDHRAPQSQASKSRTVRFASTDGRFVGLSDGSLWNIDWRHADGVRHWKPGMAVRVSDSGSGSFPYRLSASDGSSAAARYGKKLD